MSAFVTRSIPVRTPPSSTAAVVPITRSASATLSEAVRGEVGEEAADVVRAAVHGAGRGEPDVGDRPAGDHRVEREDPAFRPARRARRASHQRPPGASAAYDPTGLCRVRRPIAISPTMIGTQMRNTPDEIDDDERGAAALADLGREPPYVAQADGRSGRREDEAGARAPHAARGGITHLQVGASRSFVAAARWTDRIVTIPRYTRKDMPVRIDHLRGSA